MYLARWDRIKEEGEDILYCGLTIVKYVTYVTGGFLMDARFTYTFT